MAMMRNISHVDFVWQEVKCVQWTVARADPGFLLGGGAPLRNDFTMQDFS